MEEKKLNTKNKNSKTYIIYTILFCVISLAVFAIFIKNNKGFIWKSDGFKQHYVFLYDFNQMIRGVFKNGFSMLSWDMGLGLDVIGQYSYYVLGDPFVYLSLLFPMEYLETVYSVLVILRIYCVGLAFIAYCRYQKKETINTLIGAIIYTFCGFVLYAGIRHPYFTNAMILLPLNFIGIEKLLRENKKTFLIFIVFLSAISNYYFFYMITVINVIYAIVKYIFEYNNGIKEFWKKFFTAVGCYIVGILMASVILLPTIYAFFNSARMGYEQTYQYMAGFYKNFFMGLVSMRFSHWAVVSVSSIILLMITVLFTKLKDKEAKVYATLFLIMTAMLMLPLAASAMNGFSFPSNRWVFAYSFVLAYIVTMCFESRLQYSKKQLIIMAVFLAIYCILGMWTTKLKIKENLDFYVAMLIAVFIYFIILLSNIKWKSPAVKHVLLKYGNIAIVFLVIFNIGVLSCALYSKKGKGYAEEFLDSNSATISSATLNGKIDNFKEAIEYIKENDEEFYRIAKCDTTNQNLSLLYDYRSIQTFLSIGNGDVYNFSHSLEDNSSSKSTCVNGMDRRTKAMTLLGTKYYICSSKNTCYLPYGYELYHEIGDTKIYKNKNYLSVGVMYDNYILKEEYEQLTPLEREDVFLSTAVLEKETNRIEKNTDIKSGLAIINKVNYIDENNVINDNQIEIKKNNQTITLKLNDIQVDTELYLSIKNLQYQSGTNKTNFKISTSFCGVKDSEQVEDCLSSAYYVENPDFLINLGVVRNNTENELKVTFHNKGTYTFDELEILAVPMIQYEENVGELKKNEMTNIDYGNDYISGHVNNRVDGILQITTSYSDGWKAFVDGKETEVIKVNEGFIGTFVDAGEHEVRFEYETPYLRLGIIFSVLGIICFIGIIIFERKSS